MNYILNEINKWKIKNKITNMCVSLQLCVLHMFFPSYSEINVPFKK